MGTLVTTGILRAGCTNAQLTIWLTNRGLTLVKIRQRAVLITPVCPMSYGRSAISRLFLVLYSMLWSKQVSGIIGTINILFRS